MSLFPVPPFAQLPTSIVPVSHKPYPRHPSLCPPCSLSLSITLSDLSPLSSVYYAAKTLLPGLSPSRVLIVSLLPLKIHPILLLILRIKAKSQPNFRPCTYLPLITFPVPLLPDTPTLLQPQGPFFSCLIGRLSVLFPWPGTLLT